MHFAADRQIIRLQPRGFTLVEMLVVALLTSIIIVMGIVIFHTLQPKKASEREHVKGAAYQLAEDLRWARQYAMTHKVPVGLIIPSSQGHTQVYAICAGAGNSPKTLKTVDFSRTHPDAFIFVGYWALDSSKTSGTFTSVPPQIEANPDNVAMTTWGGSSTDCAYLFTPSGTVKTNNLPNFDGKYRIIVSKALAYSGPAPLAGSVATTGGGDSPSANRPDAPAMTQVVTDEAVAMQSASYYQLSGAWRPTYTVSIAEAGEVDVTEGVEGAPDSLYQTTSPPPMPPGAPMPPYITAPPANNPPTVTMIVVVPTQNPNTLPGGVDAVVTPGGRLQFIVKATDPDKEELSYHWTGGGGNLSSTDSVSVEWTAPAGAAPGTRYTIVVTATDPRFGSDTDTCEVEIIPYNGKIAFVAEKDGNKEIYIMNPDGSELNRITNNTYDDNYPNVSPDGKKLVCHSNPSGTDEILIINVDGSNPINLTSGMSTNEFPVFSPDGTKIVFASGRASGSNNIFVMNADGTDPEQLTFDTAPTQSYKPSWSPDGTRIVFATNRDHAWGDSEVYVMNADGSDQVRLTFGPGDSRDPRFSPDGTKIVFQNASGGQADMTMDIVLMNPDGSGKINLTNTPSPVDEGNPCFSPDGAKLVYCSSPDGSQFWRNEIYVMNIDGSNIVKLTNNSSGDGRPFWFR